MGGVESRYPLPEASIWFAGRSWQSPLTENAEASRAIASPGPYSSLGTAPGRESWVKLEGTRAIANASHLLPVLRVEL